MAKAPKGTARIVQERPIGVQEASAVAHLGDDSYLVVDDGHGIFRCGPDARPVPMAGAEGLTDLEGVCVDPAREHVFVLSERDGSVWRFLLGDGDLTSGRRLGKLPRLNSKKNQGWEGIYFAPASTFAERDELVAVHQTGPRRIAFFDAETLAQRREMSLPKAARKLLGDLNDVAVHPVTKHLFVVSGKAGRLGELRVCDDELELVRVYPIDTEKDDVPEGIAFGDDQRLWIVTDGEGMLRELQLHG